VKLDFIQKEKGNYARIGQNIGTSVPNEKKQK
jgi:hypothetical protein